MDGKQIWRKKEDAQIQEEKYGHEQACVQYKTKDMEMTINDLIKDLQNLKPSLRELPVKIQAENGMLLSLIHI